MQPFAIGVAVLCSSFFTKSWPSIRLLTLPCRRLESLYRTLKSLAKKLLKISHNVMSSNIPRFYDFGPFRLDLTEHLLLRADKPVALTPKAFDTLLVLVRNSGRIVEKDELLKSVWPETFVEEATLAQNIFTVRKALGGSEGEQYIQTVPKRGYRFVARVTEVKEENANVPIDQFGTVTESVGHRGTIG